MHPENALGSHLTVPLLSIKNVTRAVSASPKRPFPTWYAFRASPFGSLRIGYYNSSRGVPSDNQEAMETIGCMTRTVSFCFSTNSFCLSAASPLTPTISTFVRLKRSFSARVSPSPPVSCPTTVHGEGGEAAYLRAHRGTGMPPSCSRTSLRACMRGQYERVHCPRIRRLRGQRSTSKSRTGLGIEEQRHRDALRAWRQRVRLSVRSGQRDGGGGLSDERVHHRSCSFARARCSLLLLVVKVVRRVVAAGAIECVSGERKERGVDEL